MTMLDLSIVYRDVMQIKTTMTIIEKLAHVYLVMLLHCPFKKTFYFYFRCLKKKGKINYNDIDSENCCIDATFSGMFVNNATQENSFGTVAFVYINIQAKRASLSNTCLKCL